MADLPSRIYWKILIALSLVHFSGDFYSAFINPLYPVFMGKLGDTFTIQSVLMILVCIPLFSLIPIYFIPEVGNHNGEHS
jgi:FSR family fosmidomycin resistance protein-like MFS transporter